MLNFHRSTRSFNRSYFFAVALAFLAVGCTRKIYVVRHAEKAAVTDSVARLSPSDPPLSDAGKVRALVLRTELTKRHIRWIYSTNTNRAMETARPLSEALHLSVNVYGNLDSLVQRIRMKKGNALVIGHSNTVDDIVNKLCRSSRIGDLKDGEYDNLFVIKLRGKKVNFERRKYGYPSNP
jgi:phosphohistidine phosphatase SixA